MKQPVVPLGSLLVGQENACPHCGVLDIACHFSWAEWEHRQGAPGEVPRERRSQGGKLLFRPAKAGTIRPSVPVGVIVGRMQLQTSKCLDNRVKAGGRRKWDQGGSPHQVPFGVDDEI